MKCSKCGQEYADGTKFCEKCGAELNSSDVKTEAAPAAENAPVEKKEETPAAEPVKEADAGKPKLDLKKLLIPVAAVAAVIVLIALICSLFGGKSNYPTYNKNTIVSLETKDDSVYVSYPNGEFKDLKVEKKGGAYYSGDRSLVAFFDDSGELVYFKNGKLVSTGLDEIKSITVSNDGATIAYLSEVKNGSGVLYLYETKSKKSKEIADDVRVGSIVLSPDGKTVAYVSDYEAEDDFKGYYSVNGKKPVEVGKEKRVFAIADKGTYIYYKDGDRIYVQKGKKEPEKLATDVGSFRAFFNKDLSQIMYTNDGKTYISEKAKEKVKVSSDPVYAFIFPQDSVCGSYSMADGTITLTGVKSLAKQLIYVSDSIYYVKPNFESVKVASNVMQVALSKDCKKLYVLGTKQDVVEITDFAKGGKKKDLTDEGDIVSFQTDVKLKKLYVMNEDDELKYVKSKQKLVKLSDDVTSFACTKDGATCYFVVDYETLYLSKNGGKKVKIKEEDNVSVTNYLDVTMVKIYEDDTTTSYIANGKKLKEVFSTED